MIEDNNLDEMFDQTVARAHNLRIASLLTMHMRVGYRCYWERGFQLLVGIFGGNVTAFPII